ncbi:hypothetical protein LUZ60_005173 [Juncus effusus]|nr:hypothetical protein LUZ60_005173 [Juncus effusus]
MALVLHAGQRSRNAYKSLIAAEYCGVKVELAKLNGDNTLFGSSVYEYAQIEQWIDFAGVEIDKCMIKFIDPKKGLGPSHRYLCILNTHLTTNTYLVGRSITLADIIITCHLHLGFTRIMAKSFTAQFPHVEWYFWTLVDLPNFKKIMGEVKQAESKQGNKMKQVSQMIQTRYGMVKEKQMIQLQKKRRVDQMIEEQEERVNQMSLNDDDDDMA